MNSKGELAPPSRARKWTQANDYLSAMAQRRTARRARMASPRSQPEAPRLLLSTLPFVALSAGLAVLALAIAVVAWPGGRSRPQAAPEQNVQTAKAEPGTAKKGWFQQAQREFR